MWLFALEQIFVTFLCFFWWRWTNYRDGFMSKNKNSKIQIIVTLSLIFRFFRGGVPKKTSRKYARLGYIYIGIYIYMILGRSLVRKKGHIISKFLGLFLVETMHIFLKNLCIFFHIYFLLKRHFFSFQYYFDFYHQNPYR